MEFEAVIGLEIHAQLLTATKIFCGCETKFGAEPNSQTCPVCTGLPGVLPVTNRRAIEHVVKTGLALNCQIASVSRFARKNYFYPDLPKGYQISQYELPLCEGGSVEISVNGMAKEIRLTRIHLEEDAGKNIHEGPGNVSYVDLNRAGVPLMEIVTEPDISSPQEAVAFMRKLRTILRYIGVCDGNMEQGSLRCDANVSVRPEGQSEFGVKTEIKNMNSFRFVEKALEYEIRRQAAVLRDGGTVVQETRLWDADRGTTESMRSKEEAHDYRYFPDPDLTPVEIDRTWLERIGAVIEEMPESRQRRFLEHYKLSEEDAVLLTSEKELADWFEEAVKLGGSPRDVGNWIRRDLIRLLHESRQQPGDCLMSPGHLAAMLQLIEKGTISGKIAKTVFEEMFRSGKEPAQIVQEKGLVQISDQSGIESAVDGIIAAHADEVARFRAGEVKLLGFFVGQVMKVTKGKANPKVVNEILKRKLA